MSVAIKNIRTILPQCMEKQASLIAAEKSIRNQNLAARSEALAVKSNNVMSLTSIAKKAVLFALLTSIRKVGESVNSGNPGSGLVPIQVGELVCNGKPEFGRVTYVKQVHQAPVMDAEMRAQFKESQHNILDVLFKMRPKHVFTEGLRNDFSLDTLKRVRPIETHLKIMWLQFIFSGYKPGDALSENQARELMRVDGLDIYFHLAPDVTLHATTNKDAQYEVDQYYLHHAKRIGETGMFNEEDKEVLLDGGKELAFENMEQFAHSNPREPVTLIFGAGHDFQPYCGKDGYAPDMFEYESRTQKITGRT